MYINAFKKLLPRFDLEFICIDDIESSLQLDKYQAIIIGGGDLVNDYFYEKIKFIRETYHRCIYGVSIGVPYKNLIEKGYLNFYDHVFTRNKSHLLNIQHSIGTQYVHYIPDITLKSFEIQKIDSKIDRRNTIGIFLACSLYHLSDSIIEVLLKILHRTKYKLHLLCFDTGLSDDNNDLKINKKIYDGLLEYKDRIINDQNRYSEKEMFKLISSFRSCICTRFHSHILSALAGVPFLSFHYEQKSILFTYENNYNYRCNFELDNKCNPISFSVDEFYSIFENINLNVEEIQKTIISITKKLQLLLDIDLVENIIIKNERRFQKPNQIFIDRVDFITNKYKKLIEDEYNCKLDEIKDIIKEEKANEWAQNISYEITNEIHSNYVYGMKNDLMTRPHILRDMIEWVWKDNRERVFKNPKFNMEITSSDTFNGLHRSGWSFAINSIRALQSNYGPLLDLFCDSTFGWCRENPCKKQGLIPYTQPWCGFFHHTPNSEYSNNNITNSTNSKEFIQSLETCIGFFVLSNWLGQWLKEKLISYNYPKIPITVLYHPTSLNVKQFDVKVLNEKKISIVNIGAWMRNVYSIYRLKVNKTTFIKKRLKGKFMDTYFPPPNLDIQNLGTTPFDYCLKEYLKDKNINEKRITKEINSVQVLEYLDNDEYDNMMINSIIFVDFIECSAANTIIECIARCCPIVTNKIKPVVEYLGEDYPLYFTNIDDVDKLLTIDNIRKAHTYLQNPILKNKISSETFLEDLFKSEIAKNSKVIFY